MADLLSVDVDARQPAAEAGMRMVPTDYHLWSGYRYGGSASEQVGVKEPAYPLRSEYSPPGLLEHVEHLCLENWIDSFDRDAGTTLRHCKDIWRRA